MTAFFMESFLSRVIISHDGDMPMGPGLEMASPLAPTTIITNEIEAVNNGQANQGIPSTRT
jgi:hypothetical protein